MPAMLFPQRKPFGPGRAQRGLTLVELLVSVTLGLLIIGSVLYVYLGSRGAFRSTKSTSRVQEAGRFGLDAIARDLRQAGYLGCGSRVALGINAPPPVLQLATPALSFSNPGQAVFEPWPLPTSPLPTGVTGPALLSDDFLVLHAASGTLSLPMSQAPDFTKKALYLSNNCNGLIRMDNYVMLSNCSMATVLRVSNSPATTACPPATAAAPGVEVDFATTDTNGNTVNAYPGGTPTLVMPVAGVAASSAPALSSRPSAQVFDEITYYVGRLAGRPTSALYRFPLSNFGSGPEEIIDHVDDMCVTYGVNNGGTLGVYAAKDVPANGGWANVVDVRVSLLTTGDEDGVVDVAQQPTFPWCTNAKHTTGTYKLTDTRYHQVFTSTIALRDKLQ